MQTFIILMSLIFTAGVVILVLMYFGYIKDTDKDGIPDKVEEEVKKVKKKIYKKKK